jgi:hypothetical protein
MKIYLRVCIETDEYKIEDFIDNGALVMVAPHVYEDARPFVHTHAVIKDSDYLSNQVTLTQKED